MKKKVFVGISGGVDSAVAAALLKEQDYEIYGVFMKNWSGEEYGISDECPWEEDMDMAQKVCEHLEIPFKSLNFEKEYRELVMESFFKEYALGNTPNPDILCNKFIKFDLFLKRCLEDGADVIATGHYARTENGQLLKAKDQNKDQTYFLAGVKSSQLEKALFPLGGLLKSEVRELATKMQLPNAMRKDSQGICFVGQLDMRKFLGSRLKEKVGDIIDIESGKKLGIHHGVWFYTVGQRKGMEIGGAAQPYFVARKDPETNTLFVAMGRDNSALWSSEISCTQFEFINPDYQLEGDLNVRIRHRGECIEARSETELNGTNVKFHLKEKVWAPAPGQSLVAYKEDRCLGSAVIR